MSGERISRDALLRAGFTDQDILQIEDALVSNIHHKSSLLVGVRRFGSADHAVSIEQAIEASQVALEKVRGYRTRIAEA